MSEALDAVRDALRDARGWLVGGAVRDRLLGRPLVDLDVVLDGDVRRAARHLAVAVGGPAFALSDAWGAWRVIGPGRGWQVDLTPMRGASIEDDLALRDFTVNAIAEPLAGGQLLDPHDGAGDLRAGRLRMVSAAAFDEDPLRVLRLARFACELGLAPDPATVAAGRERAPRIGEVAAERIFAELKRVVAADAALEGFALLHELDLERHLLPELAAMRGVEQNPYHHLDVHGHTLAVLQAVVDVTADPGPVLGPAAAEGVRTLLAEPLADDLTRGDALRWGALLHDVAKPATRDVTQDGRISFIGHDRVGAEMARDVLARLRTAEKLRAHVASLTLHHLRLGFLVHERPLARRRLHRYLVACGPVAADVTVLSVCDRLATRGRKAHEAIARHLDLAREVLPEALAFRAARPAPLVRGDELARAVGIAPGPELGRVLAEVEEARFAGEVSSPEEAVLLARELVGRDPSGEN